MKGRTAFNKIQSIVRADGSLAVDDHSISEEFENFYRKLLGSSSGITKINPVVLRAGKQVGKADGDLLIRQVTVAEIKEALFSIKDSKSLGLDGYSSCFFKRSWEIVQNDFCDVVFAFLTMSIFLSFGIGLRSPLFQRLKILLLLAIIGPLLAVRSFIK